MRFHDWIYWWHKDQSDRIWTTICYMMYVYLYLGGACQWEFQDPKMEVLYHFSGHMLWGYSLT